ncbi:helix-turn-helix domain-containing protein [Candidatus Nitrosotalea okcheonensis]|uniref:helix-turn-helix domain-containing protein n=1 Tax=Candidatus Nitrosotalea okcheonensis TaxID=1903276 RepID=UPI00130007B4
MVKVTDEIRIRAVILHTLNGKHAKEICSAYAISDLTLRRWVRSYRSGGGWNQTQNGSIKVITTRKFTCLQSRNTIKIILNRMISLIRIFKVHHTC